MVAKDTVEDGCFLHVSLEDRVLVGIYDRCNDEELKEAVIVDTLKDYLKSLYKHHPVHEVMLFMVEEIVQKRGLLLDALLDFRQWFEDDIFAENRVMLDEIDHAMRVVKDL